MFSTFSRFSANNIDRTNSYKKDTSGNDSDSEFKEKIAKFTTDLRLLGDLSDKQRELDSREQENKKRNKSLLSKVLGDTNQMIFGAMVFAFLIIATFAVVGAGTLAVAAMGTFAAGVGAFVVAKAVKKFRNMGKSQDNFAQASSSGMKEVASLFQKKFTNDLGGDKIPDLEEGKRDKLKKELTDEIKNQLSRDTIQEKEEALKTDINRLESKLYKNLEAVMGDGYTKESGGRVTMKADALIPKLLAEVGLSGPDKEVTDLKSIMKDYDKKGLTEQKLVLKTLNDIFDKCDDKAGTPSEKDQAGKKKTELANIIKGNASTDKSEKDNVTKLITDKKGEFDDNKDSKMKKDQSRQEKKQDLGMSQ